MTLSSPTHAVLGATDVDATVAFLGGFGFEVSAEGVADPEAWGPSAAGREVELRTPGADGGHLLVVGCTEGPRDPHPYARGAHALDVYSRALPTSLDGREHGPVGHVVLGPLTMQQVIVPGPDALPLVLIETDRRRSSVLDGEDGVLHSEAHSLVWSVDDIDAAAAWWGALPGLQVPMVFGFADAEVCSFMGLPRSDVPLRMCMISDAEVSPLRLELLQFTDEAGPAVPALELRGGLHGPLFTVSDLPALPDATVTEPVEVTGGALGDGVLRRGVSPHGVGFTLWQPR